MSDRNNHKGFPSKSLAITERQFFFALTVRGRSSDWILNVHNWWHNSEHACWTVHSVSLSIREFSISNMSLIDIKNSLTMGINFSTPIFLLDSRNIVKTTILFTWNNGTNLAASASLGWLWSAMVRWVLAGRDLPSPYASLLSPADAFRVTWSEKVFEASPGRSSRIRHRNALTDRAWKDAV